MDPDVLEVTSKAAQTFEEFGCVVDPVDFSVGEPFDAFWNKGKDNESLRMIHESNLKKTQSKLIWLESFRIVFKNAFNIIGINAPESM